MEIFQCRKTWYPFDKYQAVKIEDVVRYYINHHYNHNYLIDNEKGEFVFESSTNKKSSIKIEEIVKYYINVYDEEIIEYDYWVDNRKGEIIFKLTVQKSSR